MNVVDGFIFFNELDMLEFRLRELNDVVDYFVLVESRHSFSGSEKSLYFDQVKDQRFAEYLDKIVHVVVEDMPNTGNAWDNERHQRRCIARGLDGLNLDDDDMFIISDVDEIPDARTIASLKATPLANCIHALEQDFYYYNLSCLNARKWTAVKLLNMRTFRGGKVGDTDAIRLTKKLLPIQRLRYMKKKIPIIKNGGWHLSYFGNVEFIKNKILNFSHQEFNKDEFLDDDAITLKITNGGDLFSRDNETWLKVAVSDASYLPRHYSMLVDLLDAT